MAPLPSHLRGPNNKNRYGVSLTVILSHALLLICGIYIGIGIAIGSVSCPAVPAVPKEDSSVMRMTAEEWQKEFPPEQPKKESSKPKPSDIKFPDTIKKLVMDYSTVPRDNFNDLLKVGVPMDPTKDGSEEVLVLYTDPRTVPYKAGKEGNPDNGIKHSLDAEHALENCHTVKVILQEPAQKKRQCIAIVPQWESFHVHKFMRMPKKSDGKQVSVEYPLRYVSRSLMDNGKDSQVPTWKRHIEPSYDALVDYLKHLDTSLKQLEPLLKNAIDSHKSAEGTSEIMKKSNTVVVMVSNKGQSHLFHNFVCNARSKGLDLSRIIMFATDEHTHKLAQDLGITVVYDKEIFGSMPENAAGRYGDKIFSMMMMAKVYCVHLVMSLGYDVLFQDVDVVWKQNPLEYLEIEESREWDMIFQDDGSRQARYAPYSPNTGFYFVRNNDVTTYFFNNLLKKGDLIAATKSHQAALSAQIAEFVSWKGMRVKTWTKLGDTLFPGGVEFHNSKDYMKRMISGDIKPYIFHMSWTQNKDNKKLFYEQLAEWYLKGEDSGCNGLDCCVAEPIITCHFKDKPSKIPCNDSPPIDKNGKSFW